MAVNLSKGGRVNLSKTVPGLEKVLAGLRWNTNRYEGPDFDLDGIAFGLDANGKCVDERHMVFYNQLADPENAVVHSGDNRTGLGDGDDETITIDFSKLDSRIKKIVIAVTIFDANNRNQNFGMVDDSYIRLVNAVTGEEILRYDLGEEASDKFSVVFAEIYQTPAGDWSFKAVGDGFKKELKDFCLEYGVAFE